VDDAVLGMRQARPESGRRHGGGQQHFGDHRVLLISVQLARPRPASFLLRPYWPFPGATSAESLLSSPQWGLGIPPTPGLRGRARRLNSSAIWTRTAAKTIAPPTSVRSDGSSPWTSHTQ